MQQFEISTDHVDGYTVIAARGEIDVDTSVPLRETIAQRVVEGHVHLVIDLTDVTFIDSTGLGALLGGRRRAHSLEGSFKVVCEHPTVLRMFTITGLDSVFSIHGTLDAAVATPPTPDPVDE